MKVSKVELFNEPEKLGLQRAFDMISAPVGKTFFYRNEHKRVIEPGWKDSKRLREVNGPLLYCVTDHKGVVRYFGKWESETPLYARWFRHEHIHHQTSSRTIFIKELEAGRAPLTVWSASANELRQRSLPKAALELSNLNLCKNLEALWISRWHSQLWNKTKPTIDPAFSDGYPERPEK